MLCFKTTTMLFVLVVVSFTDAVSGLGPIFSVEPCANDCFGHGTCDTSVSPARCVCEGRYNITNDCSIENVTEEELLAHCPKRCGSPDRGRCDEQNGKCVCHPGYHGFDCSFKLSEHSKAPSFMVIGAQKGGTTIVTFWLNAHSQGRAIKLHFFDDNYHYGYDSLDRRFLKRGTDHGLVRGVGSARYLLDYNVPARVFQMFPHMKMIALLREPVARAYSAYNMNLRKGHNTTHLSFDAVMREQTQYVERCLPDWDMCAHNPELNLGKSIFNAKSHVMRGLYAFELERWMKFFPREQFFITCSERLRTPQRDAIVADMFEFVGLRRNEPIHNSPPTARNTGRYPPIDPAVDRWLRDYFAPYNQRLTALLGGELCPEWNSVASERGESNNTHLAHLHGDVLHLEEEEREDAHEQPTYRR
eukprot:TRINITY_DN4151_c0_g1_i2.p1 TRINITY_DN4151_c0_g1~~TRINITY_DN4151_c0_g1_i2.p1  ORF type:complete len:417 (+),score=45.60 TRINITY_DN4151_c0_g1_i2:132-1382(+)